MGANTTRQAGILLAVGAALLFLGLMAGPTPGADTAGALRNIDADRSRYVATNLLDIVAAIVLLAGFALLLAGMDRAPLAARVAAAVATSLGFAFFVAVLVMQSAVDVRVARRFVQGSDSESQLAIARVMFDLENGLFGLALLLILWGAALTAFVLWRGGRLVDGRMLAVGAGVAIVAGATGVAYTFEATKAFGRLEPVLSIVALGWIGVVGVFLARAKVNA